jgi:uncharacterized membrane protein
MSALSTPPATTGRAATPRVQAIDVVRGLAMVIMALDHIREFWCPTPVRPEDVTQASALLFFTRWITHFCAPTFVFLAGTSIFLYQQKRTSRRQVSWFLLTRGLWLLVLEVVVINFLLQWGYSLILLEVIWVLGCGMLVLAGLIWVPRWLMAIVAFTFIAGHNLLPPIQPVTAANAAQALFHNTPFVLETSFLKAPLLVAYSMGPWAAVMAAGYVIGPWFLAPLPQRTRWLRIAGVGLLVLFFALRATNWYGELTPWSVQPRGPLYSVLSFINITKYPPSLLFLSLTLGVAFLLLSVAEGNPGRLRRWLITYGRVPLFYFLLHLALISGGAFVWTALAFGKPINFSFASIKDWPPAYHPSLLRAYVVWVVVVGLLYWPCHWYQGYKQRHSYWWLSYL